MVGKLVSLIKRPRLFKISFLAVTVILVWFVYFWRLSSLVPGLSPDEVVARAASHDLKAAVDSSTNAPYLIWLHGLQLLDHNRVLFLRLGSALVGVGLAYSFFSLLRRRLDNLTAVFGSYLLISLPWLVISSRTASTDIMWLSPLLLVALFVWLQDSQRRLMLKFSWLAVAAALLLYTPGLFWFELVAVGLYFSQLKTSLKSLRWWAKSLLILSFLIILAPLVRALILNHMSWRSWLLIPQHWATLSVSLKSIAWGLLSFVWRTPVHFGQVLARLPILSSALLVLVGLGWANLYRHYSRRAAWGSAIWLGMVIVLSGLNQNWTILSLAVPFCVVAAAFGLAYLYNEWRLIFPHNPLAKAVALILIILLVGLQLVYSLRYSLIAWPHSAATRSSYVLK